MEFNYGKRRVVLSRLMVSDFETFESLFVTELDSSFVLHALLFNVLAHCDSVGHLEELNVIAFDHVHDICHAKTV